MHTWKIKILILVSFVCAYSVTTKARDVTVTGIVRDINTHEEINNVNIFIKNTQIGTISNFSGRYVLRVPDIDAQMIVVFRHIAYEAEEVLLNSLIEINDVYLQPRVIPLQGVQVEGMRTLRSEIEADLPQTISMIDARNFEIRGYVDAGDLLRTDHSIQVEEELSGKKTVAIRGGNPDEVIVLYNGVKMNRVYDNVFDLSTIDLEDIERFEIIKGSNTALYGPEAFSGVINIVPKIQHDYNIRFQQRLGTYRSGNWGLHLYHKFNRLHGSYSVKRGSARRKFTDVLEDRRLLENTSLHHTANLNYSLSEHADGRPANSLGVIYTYSSLNHDNQRDVESLSNTNELLSLKFNGDISKLKNIDLSVSVLQFAEEQYLASGTGALHRKIQDQAIHINADKHLAFGILDMLFGYQFQHAKLDFEDERRNFQEQQVGLESAQFQRQHHGFVSITKLHSETNADFSRSMDVSLSLRHDRIHDSQADPILRQSEQEYEQGEIIGLFDTNDWQENLFKFALNFSGYNQNLVFNSFLTFGLNTKFPTLVQQISSPVMLTSASTPPNLSPEKNRSLEFSVTASRDIRGKPIIYGWQLSGNYFQNHYDNKFRLFTTPGFPMVFYDNVPNARITGLETNSSIFLLRKKLTIELGLSKYFISEKAAFPFKSDFKRTVNFIIDHAGYSFQIHWFKEGEQAGWIRQQSGAFAEVSLPEFSNLDLHVSKTFQIGKLKVFANASGRNLLNSENVILQGLALRDRRYYLTIGAQY